MDEGIRELARRLRERPRVTVMTGAGVSAASGIPTFRGPGGLWRDFRPEQLATAAAFARDPKLVWEWYAWRRELVAKAQPNRAHEVLAAWSRRYPGFALITQNVDGLHERAGTLNVTRYHGSLWELCCWDECATVRDACPPHPSLSPRRGERVGERGSSTGCRWRDESVPLAELPPTCPHCGGLARPGVVWFGEAIPQATLRIAAEAAACDLFLAIGTSAVVYPGAALAAEAASRGAFTVEINPEATPATAGVDLALPGPAEQVLDSVEELLRNA